MKNKIYDLDQLFDLPRWQLLQDRMAELTNMAIITVDYKGNPITKHSMCCPFCQSVRANPQLEKYCQVCDSRGGLEAVRSRKPYIYLCHFNIVDIAIPITVDDKYLGAIMAGQIKLEGSADVCNFEHILSSQKSLAMEKQLKEYEHEYQEIPTLTYEQVEKSTQCLYQLSEYIIETAVQRNQLINLFETFQANTIRLTEQVEESPHRSERGNYLKLRNSPIEEQSGSVLQPVFSYLNENRNQMVTMVQMAELCHLSSGYFSRLFAQQTGMAFSQYIAYQKVEWAKELLEDTDDSIENISEQLGFSAASYFIKVFKKQEGITPSVFRQYSKNLNARR